MRKPLMAIVCAAAAGMLAAPFATMSARADTATVAVMGSQHQRQSMNGCTADFWLTESPVQSATTVPEPTVTALTATVSLSCDAADGGYAAAEATISGASASCGNGSPFNAAANTATTSCTITDPPAGVYLVSDTASSHNSDFAQTFTEVVVPGTVPAVPSPIGNQSGHNDNAPCHMSSSITEGPSAQSIFSPASLVSSVTATAHMTCDFAISAPNYASVEMVGPVGTVCSSSTPDAYNFNTSFTASCTLFGQPGTYVAVFHYSNVAVAGVLYPDLPYVGPVDAQPSDTAALLSTTVL
jgi:hypothetical protein